jgi:hypothetical protein
MPSLTYDGRSFQIDGRRIWIVSGSLHYARIPREHWEDRINLAKQAGLNTIDVPVFWNRHEPRPGHFDFAGDNDLRQFVQLIGQAGLYCILRPGPYIGEDWDFGGFPVWLNTLKDVRLRASSGTFLEACSRYLNAVANRVRDLQVTSPGKAGPGGIGGGPILLVQNESQWTCGDDRQADLYLTELNRYLREAGFTVPIINANNLWQGAEGEIECWSGSGDLLGTVRQLATVRPDRPRFVIDFDVAQQATWGDELPPQTPGSAVEQRLAQILAGGSQFNIHPFHGGTNFGFWGGRVHDAVTPWGGYATSSRDDGAPLSESGAPGATYASIRRICTFASRFARVLANLDPSYRPVIAAPNTIAPATERAPATTRKNPAAADAPAPTVLHATGPQGGVAFVFGAPSRGDEPGRQVELLLPHGTMLPVEVGPDGVTWCVFDAFLGGRATLDYCNLSAFAAIGKVLVIYGRAGAPVRLSINGSPLESEVPKGKGAAPAILSHEGCTVVIATREQLESIHLTDDAVYVGVAGLTSALQPIALPGVKTCTRINAESEVSVISAGRTAQGKRPHEKVTISEWSHAVASDYSDGSSARFAVIEGPADLGTLGCPYGYGWYRCRIKSSGGSKLHVMAPRSGDRLHAFIDGQDAGVLGRGPGASDSIALPLKKGPQTLVMLADNLGRLSGGMGLGELKGLYGQVLHVEALKGVKAQLKSGEPIEPLAFRTPIWGVQSGDLTLHERVTWTVPHAKKHPIVMSIGVFPGRGLLLVNDKPIAFLERGGLEQVLLESEQLKGGANTIQVALLAEQDGSPPDAAVEALTHGVRFYDGVESITAKGEWAFARWEPPRASAFHKQKPAGKLASPTWWKTSFRCTDGHVPLRLDLTGFTKGQVYVNGRDAGRYFVATPDGKAIVPRTQPLIPAAWIRAGDENELLVFDEHGGSPGKVSLHPAETMSHA